MVNGTLFTSLETDRYVLRPLSLQDANEVFALRSDKDINKLIDRPTATSVNEAIAHINKIINTGVWRKLFLGKKL